eukprot:SAG31_NODE_4276_length_3386_cov_1.703681_5_plen_132_part_00
MGSVQLAIFSKLSLATLHRLCRVSQEFRNYVNAYLKESGIDDAQLMIIGGRKENSRASNRRRTMQFTLDTMRWSFITPDKRSMGLQYFEADPQERVQRRTTPGHIVCSTVPLPSLIQTNGQRILVGGGTLG